MIEDSIHVFIVKVEQYFLNFKRKRLRKKKHVYIVYYSRTQVLGRTKDKK